MKLRTSIHHRKCRSLGGSDRPNNLVRVNAKLHNLWHIIFGNMHAMQIGPEIEKHFMPEHCITIACLVKNPGKLVYGSNEASRLMIRIQAWESLFYGLDDNQTIYNINHVWLDPAFILLTPHQDEWWEN